MVVWLPLAVPTGDNKSISDLGTWCFIRFFARNVHVWDVDSQKLVYKLPGHLGSVNDVDFHRCRLEVLGWISLTGEKGDSICSLCI